MTIARGQPMLASDILDLTFFPVGSILMMDGSWTDGRGGWYICDGRNTPHGQTPDLKDIFIRGGTSSGTTGGSNASLSISLDASNLPSHKHNIKETPHTHVQDAHNHTQDSHNHIQDSHNHTQDSHSHTQNEHNHMQNPHNHIQSAHGHTDSGHSHTFQNSVDEADGFDVTLQGNPAPQYCRTTSVSTGYANIQNTTATNIETTAVNVAVAATNQTTVATNQVATATNIGATATNQAATAVNKAASTGITETEYAGSGAPITVSAVPAYYTVIYIKKMV